MRLCKLFLTRQIHEEFSFNINKIVIDQIPDNYRSHPRHKKTPLSKYSSRDSQTLPNVPSSVRDVEHCEKWTFCTLASTHPCMYRRVVRTACSVREWTNKMNETLFSNPNVIYCDEMRVPDGIVRGLMNRELMLMLLLPMLLLPTKWNMVATLFLRLLDSCVFCPNSMHELAILWMMTTPHRHIAQKRVRLRWRRTEFRWLQNLPYTTQYASNCLKLNVRCRV